MQNYTVADFWMPLIGGPRCNATNDLRGWNLSCDPLPAFIEAPLSESAIIGEVPSVGEGKIIFISAPGAVGKTTLARQIAAVSGGIYIDLGEADPVGGNTISGGIFRLGLQIDWAACGSALLIDGLDEARLKVSQDGFEAFLRDVAHIARQRSVPTVLFGRTGAVSEAWLSICQEVPCSILEIGYYSSELAAEFAKVRIRAARPADPHISVAYRAAEALLERIRMNTVDEGDRFAGYAPVIQAVADYVIGDGNPSALIAKIESGQRLITIEDVLKSILDREHGKLSRLAFDDEMLKETLYLPEEQLSRIAAIVYEIPAPDFPAMSGDDAKVYGSALSSWVEEHPFLDGGRRAASAVFHAAIVVHALQNNIATDTCISRELSKGGAANPFIADFYKAHFIDRMVSPEHLGVFYASLRASLAFGDAANLLFEGEDAGADEEAPIHDGDSASASVDELEATVEVSVQRVGEERARVFDIKSHQAGTLRLGSFIEDIEINAPLLTVDIGCGGDARLVAPISIQCEALNIIAGRIIVDPSSDEDTSAVHLESKSFQSLSDIKMPILNGPAKLSVAWPACRVYPWTAYGVEPTKVDDPKLAEALRRFRKFVISFRSHSKGSLKRYKGKIEHARMTKGTGRKVLDKLLDSDILTLSGAMYTLHPDTLGSAAGASYFSCISSTYSQETIDFVASAI